MITKYSPAVDPLNSLSLKNNTLGSPVPSCWKQWAKETKIFVILYTQDYNRQQNELRHFALNWAFLRFTDFKRRKYSFSFPIPSMQCCADVRATYRKQRTPQLWMEGAGEGCGFFCSPKLPHLSTMSQQFCRRLYLYSQTSLIRTPKAKARYPYFRCPHYSISRTKRTVRHKEVSVWRSLTVFLV